MWSLLLSGGGWVAYYGGLGVALGLGVGLIEFLVCIETPILSGLARSAAVFVLGSLGLVAAVCGWFGPALDTSSSAQWSWIQVSVATGIIFFVKLVRHWCVTEEIEASVDQWWRIGPLRRYAVREGYVTSYSSEHRRNAFNTGFGLTVIGTRHWWNRFLGGDGWTDTQRTALLRHEWGHTLLRLPMEFLNVCVWYWAVLVWVGLWTAWSWGALVWALWTLSMCFAAVTLLAWLEEFLCDVMAGVAGFSLYELYEEQGWLDLELGYYAHPPGALRVLAPFVLPAGGLALLAWVAWSLYRWVT